MSSHDVTLSSEEAEQSGNEEGNAGGASTPKKRLSFEEVVQRLGVESVRLYRQRREERRAQAEETFSRMASGRIAMSPHSRHVLAEREKYGETMFDRIEKMMERRRELERACKEREEEEIKKLQQPPQMNEHSRKIVVTRMSKLGENMIERSNKLIEKRRNVIEEGKAKKDLELRQMQNRQKISPASKKMVELSNRGKTTQKHSMMSRRFDRTSSGNSTSSRRGGDERNRDSLPPSKSKDEQLVAQRSVEFLPDDMKEIERLQWENTKMRAKIKKYRKQLQSVQKEGASSTPINLLIEHSNMEKENPISRQTIEAMGAALIKESFKLMRTVMTEEELALRLNDLLKADGTSAFTTDYETISMRQVEPLFNMFFHCIRCASKRGINLEDLLSSLLSSYPEDVLARFDEEGQNTKGETPALSSQTAHNQIISDHLRQSHLNFLSIPFNIRTLIEVSGFLQQELSNFVHKTQV